MKFLNGGRQPSKNLERDRAHGGQFDERAAGLPAKFEGCVAHKIRELCYQRHWRLELCCSAARRQCSSHHGIFFLLFLGLDFGARLAFPMTRRKERNSLFFIIR